MRRRKAKYACGDTHNNSNWLDYMHGGQRVCQRGKQQSQNSFTGYHWENKIYKKIDIHFVMLITIIIIIIAFNHNKAKSNIH